MFTKKITESDTFLDMPTSTQALYFHLCMSADDDGFVSNPKTIKRIVGASDDDMKLLLLKRFIISFESGIIVIKHWRMHNYIAKDRYRETEYLDEKNLLFVKPNKAYTLTDNGHKASDMSNSCIQNVDSSYTGPYTQNRIDKNSIEEDSIDKTSIDLEKTREEENSVDNPSAQNSKESSQSVEKVDEEPFITIPLNTGDEYPFYDSDILEYEKLYPAVDVRQEFRSMRGWCISNPKKRKTKKGIKAFANSWLSRAQDRPHKEIKTERRYANESREWLMRQAMGIDDGRDVVDEPTGNL